VIKRRRRGKVGITFLIAAFAVLGLASIAQAKLVGEFTKFSNCAYKSTETKKCIYSVTTSGEVVLGSKKVPIVNPVTLQGGTTAVGEDEFASMIAPTSGDTLAKVAQPVPGGLAGIINCKEIKEPFLKFSCELFFENGFTGLNSTLELAKPTSAVKLSENHLAAQEGVALEMPIKVHLENPFLGSNCYVGSSSSPIIWKLTTGTTAPPAPNTPISGTGGTLEFREGVRIAHLAGASLVDNAWSAPGVSGCGGFLVELLLNPIINAASGLPAAAGKNTAILNNTIDIASAAALRKVDLENP
jgi:hypothetical protein